MKRFLKIMNFSISVFFCIFYTIVCVDWYLGGGCSVLKQSNYEPAFFTPVWRITSCIFTWAPEGTIFRWGFQIIAIIITLALPIILAYYFWTVSDQQLKDLRGKK